MITAAPYDAYAAAKATAQKLADTLGFDYGVEKNAFGWSFFMLPRAENRYGHELRCEVVHSTGAAQPGHGPNAKTTGLSWPLQR